MKGRKTGGRVKGVLNKENQEFRDVIAARWPGYHPVVAMAALANDESADQKMRLEASKEIAQYFAPKLKAVEINAGEGMQTVILDILGRDK